MIRFRGEGGSTGLELIIEGILSKVTVFIGNSSVSSVVMLKSLAGES